MAKVSIKLKDGGAYELSGTFRLIKSNGSTTEVTQPVALCRCGTSKTMPLCDGSETTSGFTGGGTLDYDIELPRTYRGERISVNFDANFCAHVAECLNGAPAVFDVHKRPWIMLKEADPDMVAEVVRRCPTGALTYKRLDGGADEHPDADATVEVTANGPYEIRGDIEVVDTNNQVVYRATRMSLCRCGASRNRPFCDKSHEFVHFRAP